jgi:DNA-binding response OmpR family regulator
MPAERILVVDDDAIVRRFVSSLLEERGYRADTAADGDEALGLLRESSRDLVLTDLIMPRRDGFELLRDMKEDPALSRIPVIVLSMRNKEGDIVRGLELGAEDYVVKPFHALELLARISKALERRALIEQP